MGLRTWANLPRGFEDLKERDHTRMDGQWFDVRGLPNFGSAPSIANQDSGDFSLQTGSSGASYSSGISYDGNTSHLDSDASLSSYLMDGNVRALLKKVTVNEGALNQAIQSLGGGEKGLKELMGYIVSWVREHKGENGEKFSLSQNLEKLRKLPPVNPPAFGYVASTCSNCTLGDGPPRGRVHRLDTVQSSNAVHDLNQFYQPCTKSRKLMEGEGDTSGRSDVYRGRGTFIDVRGSIPEEFQYPKLETSTGGTSSSIGLAMLQGIQELQHPVTSLQSGLFSFGSGHDGLSRTVTATSRAARRNRITRQRQSVQQILPRAATNVSSACGLLSVAPPSTGMFHPGAQMAPDIPASSGRKASNADMLTFLLQKELRSSDVGNLSRIILPKKEAEMHLPVLALREGLPLQMEDFDSGYCWNIRYRFWPNNRSRMYLLENTGEFVKSHHLQEGDLLIIYRNQQGNYVLRGKRVHSESRGGAQGLQQKNSHSLARGFPEASKTEEVLKERDFGVGLEDQSCQKVLKKRDFGVELEYQSCQKAVKAEPTVLVGDDDPFFKEEVMHNIGSTFSPGLLPPLERFPSLNLDFPLDEIMVDIPNDDNDSTDNEPSLVVPKTEPAG